MNIPKLIIVSGAPASGKTTLAHKLSNNVQMPLFSKDVIKEHMFDVLGFSDREYSKKIGAASYAILYTFIEELLKQKVSLITETAFSSEYDSAIFNDLIDTYNCKALQLVCNPDPKVLYSRFVHRSQSVERHPGHVDHEFYKEFEEKFVMNTYIPLSINGRTIVVDTSEDVDFVKIEHEIEAL